MGFMVRRRHYVRVIRGIHAFGRMPLVVAVAIISCAGCRPASVSDVVSEAVLEDAAAAPKLIEANENDLTHHFGVVHPRHAVSHVVHIPNFGETAKTIKQVSRTCLCLATALSNEVIEPGDLAELTVQYTAPDSAADDKRALTVTFAEANSAPLRVVVTALVRDVISTDRTEVIFSDVGRGGRGKAHLIVENFGDADWRHLEARTQADWLTVSPRQLEVNAGRDAARQAWDLSLIADASTTGLGTHRIELQLEADGVPARAIPITLVVTSPVTAIPADIFVGRVSAHQSVERTFMLRFAKGHEPIVGRHFLFAYMFALCAVARLVAALPVPERSLLCGLLLMNSAAAIARHQASLRADAAPGIRGAVEHLLSCRRPGDPIVVLHPCIYFSTRYYARYYAANDVAPRLYLDGKRPMHYTGAPILRDDDCWNHADLGQVRGGRVWVLDTTGYSAGFRHRASMPEGWRRVGQSKLFRGLYFFEGDISVDVYEWTGSMATARIGGGAQ